MWWHGFSCFLAPAIAFCRWYWQDCAKEHLWHDESLWRVVGQWLHKETIFEMWSVYLESQQGQPNRPKLAVCWCLLFILSFCCSKLGGKASLMDELHGSLRWWCDLGNPMLLRPVVIQAWRAADFPNWRHVILQPTENNYCKIDSHL